MPARKYPEDVGWTVNVSSDSPTGHVSAQLSKPHHYGELRVISTVWHGLVEGGKAYLVENISS